MTDVLLARGDFADDTALLRLHHAAGLSVRTVEAPLAGLDSAQIASSRRSRPACIVFAVGDGRSLVTGGVLDAVARLRAQNPDLGFLGVIDGAAAIDDADRSRANASVLDAGADDVVRLDLPPCELAARVTAVVRRARRMQGASASSLSAGDAQRPAVDASRRELVGGRACVSLTAKESTLMSALIGCQGVVARSDLGAQLWTGTWSGTAKAIDMHVSNLRRKLVAASGDQWRIETVRGVGFTLVDAGRPSSEAVTIPETG